jgi:threonine/homoserine/homoserine lactone efflux protein
MPPIVSILLVLALAIVAVLFITSRNPTQVSEEQAHNYSKIIRILMVVMMVAFAVKACTG